MATTRVYGLLARRDKDGAKGHAPGLQQLTPTSPTSPASLLSLAEPTFTPLSFDSSELEFLSRASGHVLEPQGAKGRGVQASPPPHSARPVEATPVRPKINSAGQSLAPPRATVPANGYGLLSPAPSTNTGNISNCSSLCSTSAFIPPPSPLDEDDIRTTGAAPRVSHLSDKPARRSKDRDQLFPHARVAPDAPHAVKRAGSEIFPTAPAIVRPEPRTWRSSAPIGTSSVREPIGVIRTSSSASVPIRHPAPDLHTRSIVYAGNIATLEATAEAFSMTSSIEDAIRDEHEKLKRSDSQRSSRLAASLKNHSPEIPPEGSSPNPAAISLSRQSSILETYNAARHGGYSPAGYVMSPNHSLSNQSRRRASSKSSASGSLATPAANGALADGGNGEDFPFMTRHGPGKSSVRSVVSTKSGKMSLPEIAESEPPVTITQEALDEADRLEAAGEEDDETIRASAQQPLALDAEMDSSMDLDTPQAERQQPILDHAFPAQQAPLALSDDALACAAREQERPTTSGSNEVTDHVQDAFVDFDGVHHDPDLELDIGLHGHPDAGFPDMPSPELRTPLSRPPPRPQSYFDPTTGQNMLFYPAPVPAMLSLPPKLSTGLKQRAINARRSRVMSAMPETFRNSKFFLPDPLQGALGPSLISHDGDNSSVLDVADGPASKEGETAAPDAMTADLASPQEEAAGTGQNETLRRPQRLTDTDKRKSRMSLLPGGLAPELRASAFFDAPEPLPEVVIKDGSAMATLDSILDAAATAPVSAFTDHVFAGKLGDEVYGAEKKHTKRPSQQHLRTPSRVEELTAIDPKKRGSVFSLLGMGAAKRQSTLPGAAPNGRQTAMSSRAGLPDSDSIHEEAESPDDPEEPAGEDEEEDAKPDDAEEEREVYSGAPTTLLAELQLRKQQQKLRTRPVVRAYPNGLHSTLLELDAVAEVERKTRLGRRVNLAWEDPVEQLDNDEAEDEDDVPLGLLFAARMDGRNDLNEVAAEANRPLGLLEHRDLEENEPLSKRRDRLQGREPIISAEARMSRLNLPNLNTRQSRMTLVPTAAEFSPGIRLVDDVPEEEEAPPEEPEVEGETLGERMRRLKARDEDPNALPAARPVSQAFTAELLDQFGSKEEEEAKKKESAGGTRTASGKENAPPVPEEEETLGQRRKRLQAEREAREREMGGATCNETALHALNGGMDRASRRLSMADVLGAHMPIKQQMAVNAVNALEVEKRRQEEEDARRAREQEAKMASFRAAIPSTMPGSGVGLGLVHGGYAGGALNDGNAGGLALAAAGAMNHQAAPRQSYLGGPMALAHSASTGNMAAGVHGPQNGLFRSMTNPGVGFPSAGMPNGQGYGVARNYGTGPPNGAANPMGMPMAGNMGLGMGAPYGAYGGMAMPITQAPVDMVERWRQGVVP